MDSIKYKFLRLSGGFYELPLEFLNFETILAVQDALRMTLFIDNWSCAELLNISY